MEELVLLISYIRSQQFDYMYSSSEETQYNMSNNHDYLLRIPDHVLRDKILTYFGYKGSETVCTNQY